MAFTNMEDGVNDNKQKSFVDVIQPTSTGHANAVLQCQPEVVLRSKPDVDVIGCYVFQ